MHPDVCAFVSERSYDCAPALARRRARRGAIDAPHGAITGAGLRAIAVEHEGRSQASPEEADAIAAACRDLLAGATVTDDEGITRAARGRRHPRRRALQPRRALHPRPRARRRARRHRRPLPGPAGARRLLRDDLLVRRGRAARRSTSSSTRNRLNVAISRAQCLAVLVHSPRLLDADCRTLEAMELVDGACRFVELADPVLPST